MHNNGTSVLTSAETPTSEATAVFGLSYGELAVVLYASDAPTRALRSMPRDELIGWGAQGLARIGAELAWWTDYRSRRLGGYDGQWTAEMDAEYTRMWPRQGRAVASRDAASNLTRVCCPDSDANPWPGTDLRITEVSWGGRVWRVPTQDLENAARWPYRTATDPHLSAMLRSHAAPGRPPYPVVGWER